MSENPYQPPESDLNIIPEHTRQNFYVVSIKKFTVLYFITLGLYEIYWFYKNWKEYKNYSGQAIWPVPRAIFSIFFTHRLFSNIQLSMTSNKKIFDWYPGALATVYVVLSIISSILDRLSRQDIGSPISDILSILIIPFVFLPLFKAQKAINYSQGDPEGLANNSFTTANFIWIVIGSLYWLLVLYGFIAIFGFMDF